MKTNFTDQIPALRKKALPKMHSQGFALVVTLSLMILLTIIAIGLLSLSSISLRASSQGDALHVARANARMALMLAIGQVQKNTGPDQRITMTADQRTKSTDGKESSAAAGNHHWAGVYMSWPATTKDRPTPEFLTWLVSGDPEFINKDVKADTALADANSIELVGTGTLGKTTNTTGQVRVPSIKLSNRNGKSSKLAWWVGDQGVKAAVSSPPPSTNAIAGAVRQGLQAAPVNAIQNMAAGDKRPFENLKSDDIRIPLITSWQQSEFLASDVNSQQPLFHDLSAFSTGLMTSVTTGGFRKDLSMQLERAANTAPTTALYQVGGQSGINLSELWVYYNCYKEIKRSGTYNYTTSGRLESGTPYMLVESSPQACSTDDEFFLKQPTIISYQMVLSLQAFAETSGSAVTNRLYIVCDPIITLWNPLDIPVVVPQSAFISVKYWQIPYDINVSGPKGTVSAPLAASLSGQTAGPNSQEKDQNFMSIQLGTASAEQIVLKPGEVVKFSQSGPVVKKTGGASDKNLLIAKKGFNYGGGYAFPLRDLDGNTISVANGDTISYTAKANQYTSGKTSLSGNSVSGGNAHTRHFSLTHHEVYVGKDRDDIPNSMGYGNMTIDWDFGDKRLRPGEIRTIYQPGTKDANYPNHRLVATSLPKIFKPISGSDARPLSGSQLMSNKSPIMLLSFDAKTEMGSTTGTRSLARMNPKAHHVDFFDLSSEELDRLPYEFKVEPMVSWVNRSLDLSTNGGGYFGGGMTAQDGVSQVVTHSIPREPLVSLAAFQHSFANGFELYRPTPGYGSLNAREPMQPEISHAIGNSLAPSVLAPNKTEGTLSANRPLADHSYLANKALWDDWFLSGIAPQAAATHGATMDQKTLAKEFFNGNRKLPVVRYLPNTDGQVVTSLVNSFFSGSTPNNTAIANVASYLRVDGMFNVNSTSVEAWKALLGTLKGRAIVVRDANGKESVLAANPTSTTNPVAGLLNPQDLIAKGDGTMDVKDQSQWTGRRELSYSEVDLLAHAIVAQIRLRGPFLSLADFINRRVGNDTNLARSGAIQSALDSDDAKINSPYLGSGRSVGAAASRLTFKEAEQGPISYGIPGIVKQADILTPIAPVLSARSDTFIIRAYGESVDGSGTVNARAWCEAVIERNRNYIDSSEAADKAFTVLNKTNKNFGRYYHLISFRWLSPSEV